MNILKSIGAVLAGLAFYAWVGGKLAERRTSKLS